jgi:hypothetical protein
MDSEDDEQTNAWERFYARVRNVLRAFGSENHFGKADYLVLDDNYGWRETHIEVHHLKMLAPAIISQLQALLPADRSWQISVAVCVPDRTPDWPVMGLTIRSHEIIDGLKRQYFPEPYRSFHYTGSRPGTEND